MKTGKDDDFSHNGVRCKLQGTKPVYREPEYQSFMYLQAKIWDFGCSYTRIYSSRNVRADG